MVQDQRIREVRVYQENIFSVLIPGGLIALRHHAVFHFLIPHPHFGIKERGFGMRKKRSSIAEWHSSIPKRESLIPERHS